jgi:hypothetical protein
MNKVCGKKDKNLSTSPIIVKGCTGQSLEITKRSQIEHHIMVVNEEKTIRWKSMDIYKWVNS